MFWRIVGGRGDMAQDVFGGGGFTAGGEAACFGAWRRWRKNCRILGVELEVVKRRGQQIGRGCRFSSDAAAGDAGRFWWS